MQHTDNVLSDHRPGLSPQPIDLPNKNLKIFSTRGVFTELGFQETNIMLIELMKHFDDHKYDMFVLTPTREGQAEVRLAGYHFLTNELNEKKIISTIRLEIPRTMWFKVDDYSDHYVGTLLFPDEY